MAYEAMNNAGAMNSRLIVILNDTTCRLRRGRCMSAYLSRLYQADLPHAARRRKQLGHHLPKIIRQPAPTCRRIFPRLHDGRRHAV